jgi:hypothetical protein
MLCICKELKLIDKSLFMRVVFSCIGLLDRFLQQCVTYTTETNGFVTQKNLQLIAVATFLIAAKVEVCKRVKTLIVFIGNFV